LFSRYIIIAAKHARTVLCVALLQGGAASPGKAPPPAVLDVDRRVFSRMLVSPDVMADHLPDSYLAYIQQL
jgi:hypothetical protein